MSPRHPRWTLLCALWLIGCQTTEKTPPPVISPAAEERARCLLPLARPSDLVVRLQRTVIPRGMSPQREVRVMREDCALAGAEARLCSVLAPEVLDAVYREILSQDFAALGLESHGKASPHYGSRSITLTWADQTCEVADSSQRMLSEGDRETFARLFALLQESPAAPPP